MVLSETMAPAIPDWRTPPLRRPGAFTRNQLIPSAGAYRCAALYVRLGKREGFVGEGRD
jgi:hypothetical protein